MRPRYRLYPKKAAMPSAPGSAVGFATSLPTALSRSRVACKCIATNDNLRSHQLASAALREGPSLFVRIDHYKTLPLTPAEKEGLPERYRSMVKVHHVSYPAIDQPVTPTTMRWNQLIALSRSRFSNDNDASDLDYSITLATSDLICVT
jgi:hypothetical protein